MNGMSNSVYSVKPNINPRPSLEARTVTFLFDVQGNRKYLTASERAAFLHAAEIHSGQLRTFCKVLAYSGARISEVLSLTPRQIDFAAGVVVVECLKKRRRGIYRAIPLPATLLAELDAAHGIREAQADPKRCDVRIWAWCRTTVWHHVKGCMSDAKISGRQAVPKGLRHGFGVGALQSGVPINLLKKWLGHARLCDHGHTAVGSASIRLHQYLRSRQSHTGG